MKTPAVTIGAIRDAASRLEGHVHRSPVLSSQQLGDRSGTRLLLKCENLQKTGSFKVRGVLNRLRDLDPTFDGVVTISAGNHAQALAWAATRVGVASTVVMPEGASPTKVAASRGYGATVDLHGTVHEAFAHAHELARTRNLEFIEPFDDPRIVAGTGTVGLEIMADVPDADIVVVPIGGGGLISGIAAAVKQLRPGIRVYGVEPEGAAAMRKSLDIGEPATLRHVQTVADGLAPPMAGALNYEYVREFVDDVVLVSDARIIEAVGLLLTRAKLLAEPAGAAGVAALLAGAIPDAADRTTVVVVSGGNIAPARLAEWGSTWDAL